MIARNYATYSKAEKDIKTLKICFKVLMSDDTLELHFTVIFYPVVLELTLVLTLPLENIVNSAISSGIFLVYQLQ